MRYDRKYKNVYKTAYAIMYFLDHKVQNFGLTKLMKLLFYVDKKHLEQHRTSVFKQPYTKLQRGPVPLITYNIIKKVLFISDDNLYDLDHIEEARILNELIEVYNCGSHGMICFKKQRGQKFNQDFFSESQMNILKEVVTEFKDAKTDEISEYSHETNAWNSVDLNQQIAWHNIVEDPEARGYIYFLEKERNSFKESYDMYNVVKGMSVEPKSVS